MHKIALAMARGANAGKVGLRDPSGETAPRAYVFEEAFSPNWDESILDNADSSKIAPKLWRLSREIQRRHAEYDAVVTWGEKLSLTMVMQQQFQHIKAVSTQSIAYPSYLAGGSYLLEVTGPDKIKTVINVVIARQ